MPPCKHTFSYSCILEGNLLIKDLTTAVNEMLEHNREGFRLHPRKVGAALTCLGFWRRERTNQGWRVDILNEDRQRIHQLARTHGPDQWTPFSATRDCPICQELGLVLEEDVVGPDPGWMVRLVRQVKNYVYADPNSKEVSKPTDGNNAGSPEVEPESPSNGRE